MKHRNPTPALRLITMGIVCLSALLTRTTGQSPVADAAMADDTSALRSLLAAGAEVNAPQGDGMTALHWAAERNNLEMVKMLLHAGANPAVVTRMGDYSPLHLASKAGKAPAVSILLEAGSDPNARSTTGGATPLHFAAASGDAETVSSLLDHGAKIDAVEFTWGQTPLMFAAARDRIATLRVLLSRGADHSLSTHIVDLPARQAADRAARQTRDELLAAFRAQKTEGQARGDDPEQVQAAMRAARKNPPDKALVPKEESVDFEEANPRGGGFSQMVGRQGGLTALLHAAREGHTNIALALLDAGANVNELSGDRTSPALIATINGHFDLALLLLGRGADGNLASDSGTTPLYAALNAHWAPKARYPQQEAYRQQQATYLQLMEALLEAGTDPNTRLHKHLWYMSYTFDQLGVKADGTTPFWRAAYATDVEAMQLLTKFGADPNIGTTPSQSRRQRGRRGGDDQEEPPPTTESPSAPTLSVLPIHAASGVGYGQGYAGNAHRHVPDGWLPAVQYLVEVHGADVNSRDSNGYTPLHHAASRGDNDMILYLIRQGADATAVSQRKQTTADMANGPVQRVQIFPETVALLQSFGSGVTKKR